METAIFAGGCFWGMEDLLRGLEGVHDTEVGYTGGTIPNATYPIVKQGNSGHAEAIRLSFDPAVISYRRLLEVFFQIHDPTTLDRQGNDIGLSYRSEIFACSDAQKALAHETISEIDASGKWPDRVVTKVSNAGDFWIAEPEHQDYLERYPNGYTCHFVRPNWVL